MSPRAVFALVAASFSSSPVASLAQDAAPESPNTAIMGPPEPANGVSVTISPIHLAFPILELTAEVAIAPKLSAALIGGIGSVTATAPGIEQEFSAWEAGAHVRYYLTGDFDGGLQAGFEILMVGIDDNDPTVDASGDGLAFGPFIGWKWVAGAGFTFDGQLGIERLFATASASDGTASESASDETWVPLLNLNVGWSF